MASCKLPKRIKLPFADPIRVEQLPKDHELMVGCDGLWDDEDRVIYIRKSLSKQKKKEILYHELTHAVLDLARQLDWD